MFAQKEKRRDERLSVALATRGVSVTVYEVRRLSCLYRLHLHTITSLLSLAGFLLRYGRELDVWHMHQYGVHAA